MSGFWIEVEHTTPHPNPGPNSYVGPFPTIEMARGHMELYGPGLGRVTPSERTPQGDVMTPWEHCKYALERY